jgi:Holliday junction resolvase
MAQGESKRSRTIMSDLHDKYGSKVFCFKVHGSQYMMAGLPDIVGVCHGQFFAFETKMEKGKASKIQRLIHRKIKAAGGVVSVIRSSQEAIDLIEEALS